MKKIKKKKVKTKISKQIKKLNVQYPFTCAICFAQIPNVEEHYKHAQEHVAKLYAEVIVENGLDLNEVKKKLLAEHEMVYGKH